MMGRQHAASGWCVGLVVAPLLGLQQVAEIVIFAVCVAGFALLPDLDCEDSRASRVLGWFTGAVSYALRRLSAVVYQRTRGPGDRRGEGVHRHLSHTVVFATVLGGLTAVGAVAFGQWFVLGVLVFGVLLAEDAMGAWVARLVAVAGLVLAATTNLVVALAAVGGWIGPAVAVGCVTHCLGDAPTRSGCPFLFPVMIKRQRWYPISLPRRFRFTTNGTFELRWLRRAFYVLGVLLFPGVFGLLAGLLPY